MLITLLKNLLVLLIASILIFSIATIMVGHSHTQACTKNGYNWVIDSIEVKCESQGDLLEPLDVVREAREIKRNRFKGS